jgi:hypothetical protein
VHTFAAKIDSDPAAVAIGQLALQVAQELAPLIDDGSSGGGDGSGSRGGGSRRVKSIAL